MKRAFAQASKEAEQPQTSYWFWSTLWTRDTLLGDLDSLCTELAQAGVTLDLKETSEVLNNATGGIRAGADYDGVTEMSVKVDTEKESDWRDGTFDASALQIQGRNLSADKSRHSADGAQHCRALRLGYGNRVINRTFLIKTSTSKSANRSG